MSAKPEACRSWAGNGCRRGADCKYTHEGPGKLFVEKSAAEKGKEACKQWVGENGCPRGAECPYSHADKSGKAGSAPERRRRRPRRAPGAGAAAAAGGAKKADAPKRERPPQKPAEEKAKEACEAYQSERGCWRGTTEKGCPYKHEGLKCGNPNPVAPEPRPRRGRGGAAPAAKAAAKK